MPLSLLSIPGWADVPDVALAAENPALAINLNRISLNAALGMVRPEVFYAVYKHGQTVGLPQSIVDGYTYKRSELSYVWAVQSTLNQSSGWITGPDSLWYAEWIVDQATGNVESVEYYRRSGSHDQAQQSNDGALGVWTIGQRLAGFLQPSQQANFWADIPNADFVTDAPFDQGMAQTLNRDAKFSVLNSEVIYMGEFVDGQTVPLPVSPADSYAYSYSQVKFKISWRWTTTGSAFTQPDKTLGQLGTMKASINASTGAVTINITMIWNDSSNPVISTYGRIAVHAYCSRANLIGSLSPTANQFAEIASNVFAPGKALRASNCLQLQKNIREAALSSEFFGPTIYANGNTITLPSSPIDGYVYSRDEISCTWEWSDTSNSAGVHNRTAALWGEISASTGVVKLRSWRLPPGGPYVEDGNSFLRISVNIIATRGAQHSAIIAENPNPAGDAGSSVVDNNPPDIQPYAISYYAGETSQPGSNELILKHAIPADLSSVTLPLNLTGSYGGCVTAPTGAVSFTIKKGATLLGSIDIAAGATTATFTFLAAISLSPGDIININAGSTVDATMKGVFFTLSGTRT